MLKNKKTLCVAALLAAAIIGTTVYAAVANSTVVSSMIPFGGLTNVALTEEKPVDSNDDSGESSANLNNHTEEQETCPIEESIYKSYEGKLTSMSSERPYLGVKVTSIHKALYAHVPGLSGVDRGVMIEEVIDDSPAMAAGLQAYDLITRINDETIESPEHLAQVVDSAKIGDEIALTYIRQGNTEVGVKVEIKAAPEINSIARMPWLGPMRFGSNWFGNSWFDQDWSSLSSSPNVSTGSASSTKIWSESQSMKMSRDTDGNYDVSIKYKKNGDSVERQFTGTRDEVITAIDEDEELSDTVKQRLKGSLTEEPNPTGRIAKDMVNKMKEHFDKPFLTDGMFEVDPFGDSWFEDDWMNRDWFSRPSWMKNSIFDDDLGVSTRSSIQPSDDSAVKKE